MRGYIENGKYVPGVKDISVVRSSMYRAWDHDRQRQDHARELVQPYRGGNVNPEFIEAYPEESKTYGFIQGDEDGQG